MSTGKENPQQAPNVRNFQRFHYISDLSMTYEGFGVEMRVRTPDISSRGMFIHTPLTLPEGAVVNVKFRLKRSNYEVIARGEVRYCLPGVGVGVEFVSISPEAQKAIDDELTTGASVRPSQRKNRVR